MSNDTDINPEAASLRGKRPTKRTGAPAPTAGATPLSQTLAAEPGEPASVYEQMNQRKFILFDPRESAPVIEIGGHVPEAELHDNYVRSEFDASETLIPPGCVTGVSRMLWQRDQHVRRDIYAAYVQRYRSDEAE